MLFLVLLLVLAALGLVVAALVTAGSLWAWISIGLSAVAGLLLIVDWRRGRTGPDVASAETAGTDDATGESEPAESVDTTGTGAPAERDVAGSSDTAGSSGTAETTAESVDATEADEPAGRSEPAGPSEPAGTPDPVAKTGTAETDATDGAESTGIPDDTGAAERTETKAAAERSAGSEAAERSASTTAAGSAPAGVEPAGAVAPGTAGGGGAGRERAAGTTEATPRTALLVSSGELTAGDTDPAEEATDATDVLVVSESEAEVLVVDEYPRYHLAECGWLGKRATIPLPAREARELGFTPCARCGPDATIAAAQRRRSGRR